MRKAASRFDGILRCFAREPLRSAAVILLSEMDLRHPSRRRSQGRERTRARARNELRLRSRVRVDRRGRRDELIPRQRDPVARADGEMSSRSRLPKVSARYPAHPRSLGRVRREGNQVAIVATIKVRGKAMHLAVAHLDSRAHPTGRDLQIATHARGFPLRWAGDLRRRSQHHDRGAHQSRERAGRCCARCCSTRSAFAIRDAYEPLLARLGDAGFEIRGANVDGRATFTFCAHRFRPGCVRSSTGSRCAV